MKSGFPRQAPKESACGCRKLALAAGERARMPPAEAATGLFPMPASRCSTYAVGPRRTGQSPRRDNAHGRAALVGDAVRRPQTFGRAHAGGVVYAFGAALHRGHCSCGPRVWECHNFQARSAPGRAMSGAPRRARCAPGSGFQTVCARVDGAHICPPGTRGPPKGITANAMSPWCFLEERLYSDCVERMWDLRVSLCTKQFVLKMFSRVARYDADA
jgi:hypothetical protein